MTSVELTSEEAVLGILREVPPQRNKQTPLFLAVRLLQTLRANEPLYFQVYGNRPDRADQEALIKSLEPVVKQCLGDGSYIDSTKSHADLENWLTTHSQYPAVIQARWIARAIERAYSLDFPRQLKRYYEDQEAENDPGSFMVHPGDPVPVCDSIFGVEAADRASSFGTSPRNLPRWRTPDRLGTLLLAPDWVRRIDLRLNFSFVDDLRDVERPPHRIATVHNARDLSKDIISDDDGNKFWNVRPRGAGANATQLRRGIAEAAKAGARLIVLPELCARVQDQEKLGSGWQSASSDASILIAGSFHEEVAHEDTWRNTCMIYGRSGAKAHVTKTVPYVHALRAGPMDPTESDTRQPEALVEKLEYRTRPRVEIFCADRMTMMVFICVDFLLDWLRDLARELDISLLIIPSMSGKSQVFRGLIDGHVAATQAVVVFANVLVSSDESSRGYVARPGGPDRCISIDSATFGPILTESHSGVAVLDMDEPANSRWVALPTPKHART